MEDASRCSLHAAERKCRSNVGFGIGCPARRRLCCCILWYTLRWARFSLCLRFCRLFGGDFHGEVLEGYSQSGYTTCSCGVRQPSMISLNFLSMVVRRQAALVGNEGALRLLFACKMPAGTVLLYRNNKVPCMILRAPASTIHETVGKTDDASWIRHSRAGT